MGGCYSVTGGDHENPLRAEGLEVDDEVPLGRGEGRHEPVVLAEFAGDEQRGLGVGRGGWPRGCAGWSDSLDARDGCYFETFGAGAAGTVSMVTTLTGKGSNEKPG